MKLVRSVLKDLILLKGTISNACGHFVCFHKQLSAEGWKFNPAMDAAIMQKLLPKVLDEKKKQG